MKATTSLGMAAACGLLAALPATVLGDTTIFDGSNILISSSKALIGAGGAGDNGGTEVRLSWNPFGTPPGYDAGFGNSDFTPTGGNIINPVIIPAEDTHIAVTALQNPLNTSDYRPGDTDPATPGQDPATFGHPVTLRVFMTEVSPDLQFNDNGTPETDDDVWVILKEIYIYDFDATDFGPADPNAEFTTLSKNIESGWDQVTLLVDVYSDPSLYNGPLTVPTPDIALNAFAAVIPSGTPGFSPDFDTYGVFQTGFQTPTDDGVLNGPNGGLVDLEILSVVATTPEPMSALLTLAALAGVGFSRVRKS